MRFPVAQTEVRAACKRWLEMRASGFVNCLSGCTGPDPAAGVCRCEARTILGKHPSFGHPRRQWRGSAATAARQIRNFVFQHRRAALREQPDLRADLFAGVSAACDSSFSFAHQISNFGIAPSTCRKPQKQESSGQNAAASAKDRRAFTGRSGQMTHAGLAVMAVRARLGPA